MKNSLERVRKVITRVNFIGGLEISKLFFHQRQVNVFEAGMKEKRESMEETVI